MPLVLPGYFSLAGLAGCLFPFAGSRFGWLWCKSGKGALFHSGACGLFQPVWLALGWLLPSVKQGSVFSFLISAVFRFACSAGSYFVGLCRGVWQGHFYVWVLVRSFLSEFVVRVAGCSCISAGSGGFDWLYRVCLARRLLIFCTCGIPFLTIHYTGTKRLLEFKPFPSLHA